MRGPQRSRRLRRYDRRDYQKHRNNNSIAASFSQDYSSAASSHGKHTEATEDDWAPPVDRSRQRQTQQRQRREDKDQLTCATSLKSRSYSRGVDRRDDDDDDSSYHDETTASASFTHQTCTTTTSLNERVRLRAKEHQQNQLQRGRPRFPSRGRATNHHKSQGTVHHPSEDYSTTQGSTTCADSTYHNGTTVQSAPSRYDLQYNKKDDQTLKSEDDINQDITPARSNLQSDEVSELAVPSVCLSLVEGEQETAYDEHYDRDDEESHLLESIMDNNDGSDLSHQDADNEDDDKESILEDESHRGKKDDDKEFFLDDDDDGGSIISEDLRSPANEEHQGDGSVSPITHDFPATTTGTPSTPATPWNESLGLEGLDEEDDEDLLLSDTSSCSSRSSDGSAVSHVLSQLLATSCSEDDSEGEEDDSQDPCILSVEPNSPDVDSVKAAARLQQGKSYIISESQGDIVDKLVEGSEHQKSTASKTKNGNSTKRLVNQQSSVTSTAGNSHASGSKDRLACGFSVEPLSPMSEFSSAKPKGVMGMLEQFLPEDVSHGPMNRVFDSFLPNEFTADGSGSLSSTQLSAKSGTSHPLRFVNEVALADPEKLLRKKFHRGNAASVVKTTETTTQQRERDIIDDHGEEIKVSASMMQQAVGSMGEKQSQDDIELLPSESLVPETGDDDHSLLPQNEPPRENKKDLDVICNENNDVSNSLQNTSIQVISPKYRGWKPEELEVILMDSPIEKEHLKDGENGVLHVVSTADTDVCSSHSSYIRGLDSLQRDLSKTPTSHCETSSGFTIPPLPGALSTCDGEDNVVLIPNAALDDDSDSTSNHEMWEAQELDLKTLPSHSHTISTNKKSPFRSTSSQQRTGHGRMGDETAFASAQNKSCLRSRAPLCENSMTIRTTRSEEAPLSYQAKSYLENIVEQIGSPDDECSLSGGADIENKENTSTPSSNSDLWQSSLDSLRVLKATHGNQRQLLSRLIAERNGANAKTSLAKSKLYQYSDKYRGILSSKDHEIEGLVRSNQMLRIQVAQVKSAKVSKASLDSGGKEMAKKLQDLNRNGTVVDKREMEQDASARKASRLYRSERTTSSDLVEIDKCMFELKTNEVTTLQLCSAQPPEEKRDDAPSNTDSEIQVAITKIVAKETAFLKDRARALERELEKEKLKQHHKSDTNSGNEQTEKDAAVAKWKSSTSQIENFSKRLEKAQAEAKKVALENERLSHELKESRFSSQDYRDKLVAAVGEVSSLRKASQRSTEHLERTVEYYKEKVLFLENQASESTSEKKVDYHDRGESTRSEIVTLRNLVETLQGDYSDAERRRVEEAAKHEAMELDLKRTKRELESKTLDNADLLKKTEELFAAKSECDERILILESSRVGLQENGSNSLERDAFLQHYKRSVTKLEQELTALRESEKHASESSRLELSSLRDMIEKLRLVSDDAKRERDEIAATERDLKKEYEKAKFQLYSKDNELEKLTSRFKQLTQTKDTYEERIASLETEAVKLKLDTHKQSLQSTGDVEVFKLNVLKLEKEIAVTREREAATLDKARKDLEDLRSVVSSTQQQLEGVSLERDQSICELKAKSDELAKLKLDLESAIDDKHRLTSEVQQLVVTKEDYEGRLANLRSELSAAQDKQHQSLTAAEDDKHRYAAEMKESMIKQHQRELDTLNKKLESLQLAEKTESIFASSEDRSTKLEICATEEKKEKEETKNLITSYEEDILKLQKDLIKAEKERDESSTRCETIAADLERAKSDLESRILDNTELSLRVEQLYAAKEECEEKIATMDAAVGSVKNNTDNALALSHVQVAIMENKTEALRELVLTRNDDAVENNVEALLMSQMRVATLEAEVEELKEAITSQQEVTPIENDTTDDKYTLKRQKQEALAKSAYLSRENEMLSAMLDSTRDDLSRTIVEISRIEMDLDDARNGFEIPTDKPCQACESTKEAVKRIACLTQESSRLARELEMSKMECQEAQERLQLMESCRKDAMRKESEFQAIVQEKHVLLEKLEALEKQTIDNSKDELFAASEKKALMDEINRLQQLQDSTEQTISNQNMLLTASQDEVLQLKALILKRDSQERSKYSTERDISHLRSRISDLEMKLRTTKDSYQNTREKYQYAEEERAGLLADLKRAEAKGTSAEKEAAHFRIQISEMEQKLCTSEEKIEEIKEKITSEQESNKCLSEKLQDVQNKLEKTQQLSSALSEEEPKKKGSKTKQGKGKVSDSVNGSKMNPSHKRDRNELLVLREQVANLQNDILVAEEERKQLAAERSALVTKHAQATATLHKKEKEIECLQKNSHLDYTTASTTPEPPSDAADKKADDALSSQLANTLAALDQKKDQINSLETQLTQALSHQEKYAETIEFLQQELLSMQQITEDSTKEKGSVHARDKDLKINHLEDCLERVARDREAYAEQSQHLEKELATLKQKPSQDTSAVQASNQQDAQMAKPMPPPPPPPMANLPSAPISTVVPHNVAPPLQKSLFDGLDDATISSFSGIGASMSDMSVTSKTIMSLDSKISVSGVVAKHTLYAQKLNQQLGVTREREEEVSTTVSRKISLLLAEISKLNGGNSLVPHAPADAESLEFDLECRLADVAQLGSMLDLLIVDKKKNEQKLKALHGANKLYMKEVKEVIQDKDEVLERQGDVIDTLNEELAVLKNREKTEARSLISEISLLEENISHLKENYYLADTQQEQAEERYEMALRERNSLEVGLKQIRTEKEHCQQRMPKLKQALAQFQREMELRIEKLKNSEPCPVHMDQHLLENAERLKKTVDVTLSYGDIKNRKELQQKIIYASSSDTGETEYFVTLNDYDYQLLMEKTSAGRKEMADAIKAAAVSKNKFSC